MPELPECEAARKRIEDGALNRTIEAFSLGETRHMDLPDAAAQKRLTGTRFTRTRRHGKYIFVGSVDGPWLHIHLGMSGSVRVMNEEDSPPDYIRFSIHFEGGQQLNFRDPRKFGQITLIEDVDSFIEEKGLGPDALEIGDNAFAETIGRTRGAIKSALLNQKKLAGVGNLWSDEALYRSGLHPEARSNDLDEAEVKALHQAVQSILKEVVACNANYSDLPDDWLIHNRSDGATCPQCGGTVTKKTVGGRSSFFCPDHQAGAST